ncbi:MAG TPA: S53 family peptidase [Chloroflexota bacterium]|nr:S53 family peptidase [Chloroflexota bacterium]
MTRYRRVDGGERALGAAARGALRAGAGGGLVALLTVLVVLAPWASQGRLPPVHSSRPPTRLECFLRAHRPCLTPAEVRAAYGIDHLLRRGITGRGRTIAIVVSFGSPTLRADLQAFDRAFGLPDPHLEILAPLGTRHPHNSGWAGETTLDVEWAHAIAPGARIVVLESPVDETEGVQGLPEFLRLERYALRHHLVDVFSQSWAATEDTLFDPRGRAVVAQFHRFYADAAAQGVTVVTASGDDGAAGPELSLTHMFPYPVVGYPASDPLVLAVGGTRLEVDRDGRVHGETTWTGSGGGVSKLFPEPAYQRGLPAGTQRLLRGHRGLPDVAYNSAPESPILVYERGRWMLVAGTSAAAPQWAGLVALADSLAGHDLGAINAALYRLAASPRGRADLRDIMTGGIVGPKRDGSGPGGIVFRAGPGWDAATGLGSPRATSLIPDLIQAIGDRREAVAREWRA